MKTLGIDEFPEPSGQEHILKVNIIEGCSKLLTALKSDRLPDRAQHEYSFLLASSQPIHMPQMLLDAEVDISQLDITLVREGDDPTSIGLAFHDVSGNYYVASTLGDSPQDSTVDLILNPHMIVSEKATEDHPYPGTSHFKLAHRDIKSILQSILEPTKTGRYDHAMAFDFHDPEWFQGFVDALAHRATYQMAAVEYSNPTESFSQLNYTESNGALQTLDIACMPKPQEASDRLRIDFQSGLSMRFFKDLPESDRMIQHSEGMTPPNTTFYPTASELKRLHGLITRAYGKLKPAEPISLEQTDPGLEQEIEQKGLII